MSRPVSKPELIKALEKVGFNQRAGRSKHIKYIYFDRYGNKLFSISVPKERDTLPFGTIEAIRKDLKLERNQFTDLINCPLKADDFSEHAARMVEGGMI